MNVFTVENIFLQLAGERDRTMSRWYAGITTFILIETLQNGMPLTDIKIEYDIPFDLLHVPQRKHQRCKGKTRERERERERDDRM